MRGRGFSVLLLFVLCLGVARRLPAQQSPAASGAASGGAGTGSGQAVIQAPPASTPSKTDQRLDDLTQQVHQAQTSGDNAWMLTSAALVLLMTGPGLALFYGGLVRRKNVLATMMQSFTLMALITVLWAIAGYSLCFHGGNSFIGGLGYFGLHGVGAAPDSDYAATIPQQTFMMFQLMFAIITPALITGAFAERMKFSAMVLFMA